MDSKEWCSKQLTCLETHCSVNSWDHRVELLLPLKAVTQISFLFFFFLCLVVLCFDVLVIHQCLYHLSEENEDPGYWHYIASSTTLPTDKTANLNVNIFHKKSETTFYHLTHLSDPASDFTKEMKNGYCLFNWPYASFSSYIYQGSGVRMLTKIFSK